MQAVPRARGNGIAGLRQIDLTIGSGLQRNITVKVRTFDEDAATGEGNLVTGAECLDRRNLARGNLTVGLNDDVRRGATREIQASRVGENELGSATVLA